MYNIHCNAVHPHKYTAIVGFRGLRLNCWWETTPVGSHLPSQGMAGIGREEQETQLQEIKT